MINALLLYCRQGFEKECAAEITDKAAEQGIYGFARAGQNAGYVLFECYQGDEAKQLLKKLPVAAMIFARQMVAVGERIDNLPSDDRITPLKNRISTIVAKGGDLRLEVPDTNSGRELLKFCRKFTVPLRSALRAGNLLTPRENKTYPVIHLFYTQPGCCYIGYSLPQSNSPFLMGIPRLKFPADAPSRSTLKLEEAFHVFIPKDEWEERLAGGMHAVDLGASPGGWTYQLVQRSMMVLAVDNGAMDAKLMDSGQVKHFRTDGFAFRPARNNISWMVCDIVEKPARVASLVIKWLLNGWCRETIFNLKLPMNKRYESVMQNLTMMAQQLEAAGVNAQIQARQLYSDREEITVHIRRIWGVSAKRPDRRK